MPSWILHKEAAQIVLSLTESLIRLIHFPLPQPIQFVFSANLSFTRETLPSD